MNHYHGTPIGGKAADADAFCEGRCLLIPWKRPDDLERAMEFSRGFIADNSAYTFWRTGEEPNWSDYPKWLKGFARHPRFHFAFIMDAIDGSEKDNDDLIKLWDKLAWHPIHIKGVPVWHMHESIDRLIRLAKRWGDIAIGSSGQWPNPGVGSWWDRMDEAFDAITDEDGYPIAKVRGLRMLRRDIIERYPFASCDSTNAVQNGSREAQKNGVDRLWGCQTIARRTEQVISPSIWNRKQRQQADLFTLKNGS